MAKRKLIIIPIPIANCIRLENTAHLKNMIGKNGRKNPMVEPMSTVRYISPEEVELLSASPGEERDSSHCSSRA